MKNFTTIIFCIAVLNVFGQNAFPPTGNVGIGTNSPSYQLDITNPSGGPQTVIRARMNNVPNDYFLVMNQTTVSGQFIPGVWGYHETDNRKALYIVGAIGAGNDSGTESITIFDSRIGSGPVSK